MLGSGRADDAEGSTAANPRRRGTDAASSMPAGYQEVGGVSVPAATNRKGTPQFRGRAASATGALFPSSIKNLLFLSLSAQN